MINTQKIKTLTRMSLIAGALVAFVLIQSLTADALSSSSVRHVRNTSAAKQCQIDKYLHKKGKGQFKVSARSVVNAANRFNVNPALMVGIAHQESDLGKTIGNKKVNRNPGNVKTPQNILQKAGIRSKGYDSEGHVKFSSWYDGWKGMAELLDRDYAPYGRETAYEIVTHGWAEANHEGWAETVEQTISEINAIDCGSRNIKQRIW